MREKEIPPEQKPQVNISRPTAERMWLICFCAGLGIIQSGLTDSGASLITALTALAAAILTELLITYRASGFEKIKDGSAAASALIFSLLLPNQIHPVYAGLGAAFAMGVVKHSFGGLGANWVNPSLGGWLFIRFSWPAFFEQPGGPERISGAASALDGTVRNFLNTRIFSFAGAELPPGYIDLLGLRTPGIIADRGLLALLLGTIIIAVSRSSRVWIPAVYLGVFGGLVRIFGALPYGGLLGEGDVLLGLFSGGTLAAAFLLATDPATGAKSNGGAIALAVFGALLSWFFRYQGLDPYGAFLAFILVNAFTPLVRSFEARCYYTPGRSFSP
jgi:electron transport complex protein RnfD